MGTRYDDKLWSKEGKRKISRIGICLKRENCGAKKRQSKTTSL